MGYPQDPGAAEADSVPRGQGLPLPGFQLGVRGQSIDWLWMLRKLYGLTTANIYFQQSLGR